MRWLARVFAGAVARRVAVVVVGLLVALVAQCARAEGTVAPSGTTEYAGLPPGGQTGWYGDPGSACAATAVHPSLCTSSYHACGVVSYTTQVCNTTRIINSPPGPPNAAPDIRSWSITSRPGNTCPANATLSANGATCTCNANFVPNAGATACVPKPGQCDETLAKPLGSVGQEFSYPMSVKAVPSRVCSGGCGYIPSGAAGSGAAMFTKLGNAWTYVARSAADWIGDGQTCTPAPVGSPGTPTTPPQSDPTPPPPGKCKGTVNGVEVIVACDSTSTSSGTSGAGSSSSGAPTTGPGNGQPEGTSTKGSETTCTGSTCTTTTTTTTQNSGGTQTTTTETETEDKGDYCSEHPGSPQCEEEDKDPCEDSDTLGCMKPGTLEATPLGNVVVPLAITPSDGYGPSNASCPAPQTATLLGRTYSFSWQPFCDLATGIRPVVLALAWLSAAIGFLGLSRKGN